MSQSYQPLSSPNTPEKGQSLTSIKLPQSAQGITSEQIPESLNLTAQFFNNLTIWEEKYQESQYNDEISFKQLVESYTDCVTYFQLKGDGASEYFQRRLKNLIRSAKNRFTRKHHEQAKSSINNGILKQMQKQDISRMLASEQKKIVSVKKNIDEILKQQDDVIQERRRKTRNCSSSMTKSRSVTFSFDSFGSSPGIQVEEKGITKIRLNKEKLFRNLEFLFKKDIQSDQDDGLEKSGQ